MQAVRSRRSRTRSRAGRSRKPPQCGGRGTSRVGEARLELAHAPRSSASTAERSAGSGREAQAPSWWPRGRGWRSRRRTPPSGSRSTVAFGAHLPLAARASGSRARRAGWRASSRALAAVVVGEEAEAARVEALEQHDARRRAARRRRRWRAPPRCGSNGALSAALGEAARSKLAIGSAAGRRARIAAGRAPARFGAQFAAPVGRPGPARQRVRVDADRRAAPPARCARARRRRRAPRATGAVSQSLRRISCTSWPAPQPA